MSRPLIAACVLVASLVACSDSNAPPTTSFHATDITGADYGGTFALTDHQGRARSLADFRGKVVTLFFGYTQCPDVCPTSLATMAEVMRLLDDDAGRVQVLFATLDPERDTRELLAQYVPAFDFRFLGLYGDAAQTAAAAKEFRVFFAKAENASGADYTIDHSTGTYIFDPAGRLRLYVRHGTAPEAIAADIRTLLAAN